MTLDQKLEQELIDFMCQRFEEADCVQDLETCVVALQMDITSNASYTLVPGALERMWGVYRQREMDLQSVSEQCLRFAGAINLESLKEEADKLKRHINRKPPYTFSEDALERMRAAYSRRLAELRELALDTSKPQG